MVDWAQNTNLLINEITILKFTRKKKVPHSFATHVLLSAEMFCQNSLLYLHNAYRKVSLPVCLSPFLSLSLPVVKDHARASCIDNQTWEVKTHQWPKSYQSAHTSIMHIAECIELGLTNVYVIPSIPSLHTHRPTHFFDSRNWHEYIHRFLLSHVFVCKLSDHGGGGGDVQTEQYH